MITVGLTGGIGSGKSTVSAGLVRRGAVLVDADLITRELQVPGAPVFNAMVDRFGPGIVNPDGTLDRGAVASIVFSDDKALADLNAIVHPRVAETITSQVALAADDPTAVVILDVPLLVEGRSRGKGSRYEMQAVLVVDCPVDVAVERLVRFRGFDEADARSRASSQATRPERLALADFVIDNSGDAESLGSQIERAWEWLCSLDHPEPPASTGRAAPAKQPEPGAT